MLQEIAQLEDQDEQESKNLAQRGATLVEYALLITLIAIVCATAVGFLGNGTSARFESVTVPLQN